MCIYNDQHVEAQSIRSLNPKRKCNFWKANGKTYKNCFFGTAATRTSTSTTSTATPILTIKNVGTDKCLDSNRQKDVYILNCNGGNNQKWYRFGLTLKNVATGLLLDSTTWGVVSTNSQNFGRYQNWRIQNENNYVLLQNDETSKILGINLLQNPEASFDLLSFLNPFYQWRITYN